MLSEILEEREFHLLSVEHALYQWRAVLRQAQKTNGTAVPRMPQAPYEFTVPPRQDA